MIQTQANVTLLFNFNVIVPNNYHTIMLIYFCFVSLILNKTHVLQESYPSTPPIWFVDSDDPSLTQVLERLEDVRKGSTLVRSISIPAFDLVCECLGRRFPSVQIMKLDYDNILEVFVYNYNFCCLADACIQTKTTILYYVNINQINFN